MAERGSHNSEPVVRLVDVHKRFDALEVLKGIDLELKRGQTLVIIGESGSGKSVLLKHITGLLHPDRGEVYYHGQRIDLMSERELVGARKHFGFLFQLGALFDSLTVGENVAFPVVEHTRTPKERIAALVREKLTMVGLEGLEGKRVAELSGGQKKRVALARAIALDPELILYDEPTTGLDPPRADEINKLIIKLKHELGATGVVVTHDMTSAFQVADRITMLFEGKFIVDGTPDEVVRSNDPRVQRFIAGRVLPDEMRGGGRRSRATEGEA